MSTPVQHVARRVLGWFVFVFAGAAGALYSFRFGARFDPLTAMLLAAMGGLFCSILAGAAVSRVGTWLAARRREP